MHIYIELHCIYIYIYIYIYIVTGGTCGVAGNVYIYIYIYIVTGGTCGVAGNGLGNSSSNPGQGCLHFTKCKYPREKYEFTILSIVISK